MSQDLGCQLVAVSRNGETFVVLYDRTDPVAAMRTLGRWAMDPELSFTWYEATIMSMRVRQLALQDGIGTFSHGGSNDVGALQGRVGGDHDHAAER